MARRKFTREFKLKAELTPVDGAILVGSFNHMI
jgi:hypothetical protein